MHTGARPRIEGTFQTPEAKVLRGQLGKEVARPARANDPDPFERCCQHLPAAMPARQVHLSYSIGGRDENPQSTQATVQQKVDPGK